MNRGIRKTQTLSGWDIVVVVGTTRAQAPIMKPGARVNRRPKPRNHTVAIPQVTTGYLIEQCAVYLQACPPDSL